MPANVKDIRGVRDESHFEQKVGDYHRWKSELSTALQDYQQWLQKNKQDSPEIDLRIFDALEALRSDRLTIAFVAEFSRGKTELINALFFANYKRRLLPSAAGRTTMCPTELFYDNEEQMDYIRLLPIETRLENTSIADYKRDTSAWKTLYLNAKSADEMEESLKEVIKTKTVPTEEAQKLGLITDEMLAQEEEPPESVEIPVWRHALISFHHPLLVQGLTILDTPGLNALGSEPELTISMIPKSQAVLFILAADTGVTRSDMEMWQQYIGQHYKSKNMGMMAALNKIDVLWDEMKTGEEVESSIEKQRHSVAKQLDIEGTCVFPISAQKALLARSRDEEDLLRRSNILPLENHLADVILPTKQRLIWQSIVSGIEYSLDNIYNTLKNKLETTRSELEDMRTMCGENVDKFQEMMNKAREQQAIYLKDVEHFQSSHRRIKAQSKVLLNTLSPESIDKLIAETRKQMVNSWTTVGLKKEISLFFDSVQDTLQIVSRQTEQTRALVTSIYQKFHEEHGFPEFKAKPFPISDYSAELQKLSQEAETFRTSASTTLYEQSIVVKKFFISLVSHVRNTFINAHHEMETWLKELVNPLVRHIKDKKGRIEQQLKMLSDVKESRNTLETQIAEMEQACAELEAQLQGLDKIREVFYSTAPPESPDTGKAPASVENAAV